MKTPWSDSDWSRVLVYGLGVSGLAASRFLRRHDVSVVAVDQRRIEEISLGDLEADDGVELLLGGNPQVLPGAFDGVVTSPGVSLDLPLLRDAARLGVPVISEVELAFPFLNGPTLGITGSNGKSTTTAMAGAALRASGRNVEVCGNIGVPLVSRVEGEEGRIFVVELSSFQLESVATFRPQAAALLNLSADHLDRHQTLERYLAAKARIFEAQKASDIAVLNADDPYVAALGVRARRRFFSRLEPVTDGCYLEGGSVVETAPGATPVELFQVQDLQISGLHNLENAMAAALLVRAMGVRPAAVRSGLSGFQGLPHRLERVAELDGVSWFNDSKGTNLDATIRSLEGFEDDTVHLILGGRHKGGDLSPLVGPVAAKARRVYLIGEAAGEIGEALGTAVPTEQSGDLESAVRSARSLAKVGDSVVLSPACASFDQYDGFEQRGEHFRALVESLQGDARG